MRSPLLASLLALTLSIASSKAVISSTEQMPLNVSFSLLDNSESQDVRINKKRPLKGRFLHITDIHPDPHYKAGSTFDSGCHRKPKKDKKVENRAAKNERGNELVDDENLDTLKKTEDLAGKWGTAVSDCDCPMSLVNITFDWLKEEWANEIDFVVWTGDNARHDIDRRKPRTPKEIFDSNRMIVDRMLDTFGRDMPIVPSIGNNDIYPHNVLAAGPNRITEEFLLIWKHFIPSEAGHVFERGAYFSVEVIPDRLAVISLNTLFWYDSNTLVDGCRDHSKDPGALEMDWLEVQLDNFRQRGMQVWLTGHVPPHMSHYYDNCYLRYGDLALRYQDTIVGHLFGHMNIDHFFFIDVDELEATSSFSNTTSRDLPLLNGAHLPKPGPGKYTTMGRSSAQTLEEELRKDFGEMPGPGILKLKDYAVMNVAPSVIPTYYPGIRVFSYNISDEGDSLNKGHYYQETDELLDDEEGEDELEELEPPSDSDFFGGPDERENEDIEILRRSGGHRHDKPKGDCSLPENEDKPHCTFKRKPRHYSKRSPSRTNRALSPLGYTQFYLPSMMNQKKKPEWEIEYTTYKVKKLVPSSPENTTQPLPVPLHLLPDYDPRIFSKPENKTEEKEVAKKRAKFYKAVKAVTPYRMKDLTIGSWVKLARMLVLEKKRWKKFAELMVVSTETD
ncbi:endopolyphosphatase [Cryptococcus deuterogattii R265]|uniref:Endopolyphosphatase n=1 Tax=Cryptococcus deuterogattii (strain R265) TaxID=294750 RepID=A0A095CC21_CRYD2|nr:endopolyphosphatase [Cryptococcus deuterogattii R265]KIR73897.1 endopolyphosphatase [Cryptococcus deuterogattii CA1014]